ncbi:MAG: hypothetical protein FWH47_05685 [Methanomassiliicoccaceae archaeon]|nr:hypothetical protein [Methanomassiliicoccaceae archaeon]
MVEFESKASRYAIIALMGGIVGIVSVFVAWLDYWGIVTVSGWKVLTTILENTSLSEIGENYPFYMPLVILVFSVCGMLCGLLALFKPGRAGGRGAVLSGAIVAVAPVFFIWKMYDGGASEVLSFGAFVAIAAGVVMVISGALMNSSRTAIGESGTDDA